MPPRASWPSRTKPFLQKQPILHTAKQIRCCSLRFWQVVGQAVPQLCHSSFSSSQAVENQNRKLDPNSNFPRQTNYLLLLIDKPAEMANAAAKTNRARYFIFGLFGQ